MRKILSLLALTFLWLAIMDVGVAGVLRWTETHGKMGGLVRYFEYGRSVPGKLARWEANPDAPANLYDVAWRPDIIAASQTDFRNEPAEIGPVVRSYGMSFTNNIIRKAQAADPALQVDLHSGPGAPPNFTYALFLEDRENRRPGDIVVFGVLSSSLTAMASLSNRTWAFEQPAPFTYPVFYPDGDALSKIEPLIENAEAQRTLQSGSKQARSWTDQLSAEDAFYSPVTFGAPWLDYSPFARLVRRSLAKNHVDKTKQEILTGKTYPYTDVLPRMIMEFDRIARSDGQIPIVMLIQTRNPHDANLLVLTKAALDRSGIRYLATEEHFDPQNPSGFLADGHYKPDIDERFGEHFLTLLQR